MDTGVGIAYLAPPVGSSVGSLAACPSTGLRQCAPNGTAYSMGGNPQVGTLEQITMLDNSGNPISAATIESGSFLWFQTLGSACGVKEPLLKHGGCAGTGSGRKSSWCPFAPHTARISLREK